MITKEEITAAVLSIPVIDSDWDINAEIQKQYDNEGRYSHILTGDIVAEFKNVGKPIKPKEPNAKSAVSQDYITYGEDLAKYASELQEYNSSKNTKRDIDNLKRHEYYARKQLLMRDAIAAYSLENYPKAQKVVDYAMNDADGNYTEFMSTMEDLVEILVMG